VVEFRLFSTSKSARDDVEKIRIHSPERDDRSSGFVIAERPPSHYFQILTPQQKMEHSTVALSGSEVLVNSRSAWPGCTLPWRVIKINEGSKRLPTSHSSELGQHASEGKDGRSRMGKKARIVKRKKLAAGKEKAEMELQQQAEREVADREKRARRNKEKKIKKRVRDRAKKVGALTTADAS
jgi:hypothetical protein